MDLVFPALVIADSHGELQGIDRLLRRHHARTLVHLGDVVETHEQWNELIELLDRYDGAFLHTLGNCDDTSDAYDRTVFRRRKSKICKTYTHKIIRMQHAPTENLHFILHGHTHEQHINGCTPTHELSYALSFLGYANPGAYCDGEYAVLCENEITFYNPRSTNTNQH